MNFKKVKTLFYGEFFSLSVHLEVYLEGFNFFLISFGKSNKNEHILMGILTLILT
jgi:hypothetical protein